MAFYCDYCNYIFYKKRTSCPYCGMSLDSDQLPEEELLAQGYSIAPGEKKAGGNSSSQSLIEQMSNSFNSAWTSVPAPKPKPVEQSPLTPAPAEKPMSPTPATEVRPKGIDYFAALSANTSPRQQLPVVQFPTNPEQADENIENYNRILRELANEQRRLLRRERLAEILHVFSNIPTGSILRILLFIAIILALIGLWSARYAILNALLDLVMSILPTLLVLWLIWTIIRSFFR